MAEPRSTAPDDELARRITAVVRGGNCTGCGACAVLSPRVRMHLDDAGFQRPAVDTGEDVGGRAARSLAAVCPGILQRAVHPTGASTHPVFGPSFGVWRAWAADPRTRHAGSSGGVLTAMTTWLLETGRASEVAGVGAGPRTTTVPVRITTREEALGVAGSRYAPVSGLDGYRPGAGGTALVAKPCEVTAAARLEEVHGTALQDQPVRLSFFCAGTPSQGATDRLVSGLGQSPSQVSAVRYRGQGWPGRFTVTADDGRTASTTYEESWGQVLGRSLQPRCKICVDGTGADADLAVGDLWAATEDGFPDFQERPGESVLVARTARGLALALAAERDGALVLGPATWDEVERSQPLQVTRRVTLAGRLLGRALAGRPVPRYEGFGLWGRSLRTPLATARATVGSWLRAVKE